LAISTNTHTHHPSIYGLQPNTPNPDKLITGASAKPNHRPGGPNPIYMEAIGYKVTGNKQCDAGLWKKGEGIKTKLRGPDENSMLGRAGRTKPNQGRENKCKLHVQRGPNQT
jgi:hypothetical protein